MNKKQFLNDPQVKSFINWFQRPYLEEGGFIHQYAGTTQTPSFSCSHIEEANHYWPIRYEDPISGRKVNIPSPEFTTTKYHLDYLGSTLTHAYDLKDEASIAKVWKAIYKWGGVLHRPTIKKHLESLQSQGRLLSEIEELVNIVNTFELNSSNKVYMDSGLTKVLSLLVPSVIIYDSRVSAALCLLIRKFCEDSNLQEVPEVLHIHSLESVSKKGTRNRNASTTQYKFKFKEKLNHSGLRLEDTIKASWLIEGIIQKHKSPKSKSELYSLMHDLEAKLFMIGYDVSGKQKNVANHKVSKTKKHHYKKKDMFNDKTIELKTLGKGTKAKSFYVVTTDEQVHFFNDETLDEVSCKVSNVFLSLLTTQFMDKGPVAAGLRADDPVKGGIGEWLRDNSPAHNLMKLTPAHGSRILSFLQYSKCVDHHYEGNKLLISFTNSY